MKFPIILTSAAVIAAALGAPVASFFIGGAVLAAAFACLAWIVGAEDTGRTFGRYALFLLFGALLVTMAGAAVHAALALPQVQHVLAALLAGAVLLGGLWLLVRTNAIGPAVKRTKFPVRERVAAVEPVHGDGLGLGGTVGGHRPRKTGNDESQTNADELGLFGRRS
jgi:hypothetical protein